MFQKRGHKVADAFNSGASSWDMISELARFVTNR